jgi:NitT/TauT family transport system permease protein
MARSGLLAPPFFRPDTEHQVSADIALGEAARPLSPLERLLNLDWFRQALILLGLALGWDLYASYLDNPLILPTFRATAEALWEAVLDGELPSRTVNSLEVLLIAYGTGLAAAAVLTALAVLNRTCSDILLLLTSMFNPLPAIALLPLALLWFGLGTASIVFVIVHSVLWAVALNTQTGFASVSPTLRMAGMNYGLSGLSYIARILVPAAFPSILTGLKIGWAFAWRTLIAAELVFGVSSRSGGLGWYIFEKRNELETADVFAGLMTVIIIGLLVENVVFRTIEVATVRRWGLVHVDARAR